MRRLRPDAGLVDTVCILNGRVDIILRCGRYADDCELIALARVGEKNSTYLHKCSPVAGFDTFSLLAPRM
jgi:hypothetical protein